MKTEDEKPVVICAKPVMIRGPQLRARWGGMSNTAFYDKLRKGQIPPPHYPFGDKVPWWLVDEIEVAERRDKVAG